MVWVYRVFWAKIETKPQKKIHTRLKQSFFLFIYLFIYLLLLFCYYYYLDKAKKSKEKTYLLFFFIFLYPFLRQQNIIIYSIIYLAGRNWVLTPGSACLTSRA